MKILLVYYRFGDVRRLFAVWLRTVGVVRRRRPHRRVGVPARLRILRGLCVHIVDPVLLGFRQKQNCRTGCVDGRSGHAVSGRGSGLSFLLDRECGRGRRTGSGIIREEWLDAYQAGYGRAVKKDLPLIDAYQGLKDGRS